MIYFVNEEKRTCVAKLPYINGDHCPQHDAVQYWVSILHKELPLIAKDELEPIVARFVYTLMKREYTGIAKCHESDTFNAEVGKNIARAYALRKYYTDLCKVGSLLTQCFDLYAGISEKASYKVCDQTIKWAEVLLNPTTLNENT